MPTRHFRRLRLALVPGLLAGLLQGFAAPPVVAACAPAPAVPARCCAETAPPACPSCPSDSRPSCPKPLPSRARVCLAPDALLPGDPSAEMRDGVPGETSSAAPGKAPAAAARSTVYARRAAVTAASPPPRLLACTFRN